MLDNGHCKALVLMRMKKVLIIEDNQMTMDLVVELLEEINWEALQAYDGETGIVMAEQYQPDLILMDIHLPGRNGYEVCELLKASPATQAIPILAFTALSFEQEKEKALQSGCLDVINKPIDINTFANTIASYLES